MRLLDLDEVNLADALHLINHEIVINLVLDSVELECAGSNSS